MRLLVDATPEELRDKRAALLTELAKAVSSVDGELADALLKALPSKEQDLKFPVLQEIAKRTQKAYQEHLQAMLDEIGEVLSRSTDETSGVLAKAVGGPYIGPRGGQWADPEMTQHWEPGMGQAQPQAVPEPEPAQPSQMVFPEAPAPYSPPTERYPDTEAGEHLQSIGDFLFSLQYGREGLIDAKGFNSHDLVNWQAIRGDAAAMRRMLRKYKRQISDQQGIDHYHKMGLSDPAPATKVTPVMHPVFGSLQLQTNGYLRDRNVWNQYLALQKKFKARFDGERKTWYIPKNEMPFFDFDKYRSEMEAIGLEVEDLPEKLMRVADPKGPSDSPGESHVQTHPMTVEQAINGIKTRRLDSTVVLTRRPDGVFAFYTPYTDKPKFEKIRELFSNKTGQLTGISKFNESEHSRDTHEIDLAEEALDKLKAMFPEWDFIVEGLREGRIERDQEIAESQLPIPEVAAKINPKFKLLPYQNEGVRFIDKGEGNAIIGDEMGLGKTLQALAWGAMRGKKILVVCPKVVRRNWLHEATKFFPDYFKGHELMSKDLRAGKIPDLANVTIATINYEALDKFKDVIEKAGFDTLVIDESHRVKNPKAKQTQAVLKLAEGMKHHILLSGTAIKNKKEELFTQLAIVAPNQFSLANLRFGTIGGVWQGMRKVYLARQKNKVLKDLPEKSTTQVRVDVPNAPDLTGMSSIGDVSKIRGQVALAKVPATAEMVNEILASSDSKILVFTESVAAAKSLAEKFGDKAILHGGWVRDEAREISVEEWQHKDEQGNFTSPKRVFVTTRPSMAVGATLTAADKVVFNDLPWTAADVRQAEDRAHRIGQKKNVNVYWIQADGNAFDESVATILFRKYELGQKVNQGKQLTPQEREWMEADMTDAEVLAHIRGASAGPQAIESTSPPVTPLTKATPLKKSMTMAEREDRKQVAREQEEKGDLRVAATLPLLAHAGDNPKELEKRVRGQLHKLRVRNDWRTELLESIMGDLAAFRYAQDSGEMNDLPMYLHEHLVTGGDRAEKSLGSMWSDPEFSESVPEMPFDETDALLKSEGWIPLDEELGDILWKSERPHKYIRRVPYTDNLGVHKYRYYYRESASARGARAGEEVTLGEHTAHIKHVDESGAVTMEIGGEEKTVNHNEWHQMMAHHYGEGYYQHVEHRAIQAVNAVLRNVPGDLLEELKGDDSARMNVLKTRVPEVYAKLQAAFQRVGVDAFQAKQIIGHTMERRGWEAEARAAVIGAVLSPEGATIAKNHRQIVAGAENLAGGMKVEAKHVAAAIDLRRPRFEGDNFGLKVTDIAKKAETELTKLQHLLHAAKTEGGTHEALMAQALAFTSTTLTQLNMLATAYPGMRDKLLDPMRRTMMEVPSMAPRSEPTAEGSVATLFVAGEGGKPRALKARYRLMEAKDVIPSHDPESFQPNEKYPTGVQERAYHRDKDEQQKVIRNATRMNAAFLINTNPDAVNGPPIVTSDGVVLGGNSRTMSMQRAFKTQPDQAKTLKDYLRDHASEVGLTAYDVDAMESPILVRMVDLEDKTPKALRTMVRQMNENFTQALDPRTYQVALGRRLDTEALNALSSNMVEDESLNDFLATGRSKVFVDHLSRVGVIDERNSNQYIKKGTRQLNEDGKVLVSRILVGNVVDDADVLSDTPPKLLTSLAGCVPYMLQAKSSGPEFDLSNDLQTALHAYNYARDMADAGKGPVLDANMPDWSFNQLFAQQNVFGEIHPVTKSERAMILLESMIRKSGPRQMTRIFREYTKAASLNRTDQMSLAGPALTPAQVLTFSIEAAGKRDKAEAEAKAQAKAKAKAGTEQEGLFKAQPQAGPFIGPKGGKYADPELTISWRERTGRQPAAQKPIPTPRAPAGSQPPAKQPITDAPAEVHQQYQREEAKTRGGQQATEKPKTKRNWVDHKPGLPKQTIDKYRMDEPDGTHSYVMSRKPIHDKILEAFMGGKQPVPKDRKKTAFVMMGGPASGKTTLAKLIAGKKFGKFINVNPDDVREMLPEYQEAIDFKDDSGKQVSAKDASAMTHEEASDIAGEVYNRAIDGNFNLVFDGTGKNVDKHRARVASLKDHGYHVVLLMPHLDLETALVRAGDRAEHRGRTVPEPMMREAYPKMPGNFESVARTADEFHLYHSGGPVTKPPQIVWSGGEGKKDKVHHPELFQQFQEEAKRSRVLQGRKENQVDLGPPKGPVSRHEAGLSYKNLKKSGPVRSKLPPFMSGDDILARLQETSVADAEDDEVDLKGTKKAMFDRDVGADTPMGDDFDPDNRRLKYAKEKPTMPPKQPLSKAAGQGPFIGPKGGKWANPEMTIPWEEGTGQGRPPAAQEQPSAPRPPAQPQPQAAGNLAPQTPAQAQAHQATGDLVPSAQGQAQQEKPAQPQSGHSEPSEAEMLQRLDGQLPGGKTTQEHFQIAKDFLAQHRAAFGATMKAMQNLAGETGEVSARVKDLGSALNKLVRKPKYGTADKLQDGMGARIQHQTVSQVWETVKKAKSQFKVVTEDNYLDTPLGDYRSYHLILEGPTGLQFELQVRTHNQNIFGDWAHKGYKPETAEQEKYKDHPDVKRYSKEMSEYFWEVDNEQTPKFTPECPPVVQQVFGCMA
jgi:ppGpp synthetase/RelA/SpoT-type nucleotidyltranferase/predicted ABC-type ATPase